MPKLEGRESTRVEYALDGLLVNHFLVFDRRPLLRCCVRGCGATWDPRGAVRDGGAAVVLESNLGELVGEICPRHVDELTSLRPDGKQHTESKPRPQSNPTEQERRTARANNELLALVEALESRTLYTQDLPPDLVERMLRFLRTGLPEPVADVDPNLAPPSSEQIRIAAKPPGECERCNYDRHQCPGCGVALAHGMGACGECDRRITLERAAQLMTQYADSVVVTAPDHARESAAAAAALGTQWAGWFTERAGSRWISRDWPLTIARAVIELRRLADLEADRKLASSDNPFEGLFPKTDQQRQWEETAKTLFGPRDGAKLIDGLEQVRRARLEARRALDEEPPL